MAAGVELPDSERVAGVRLEIPAFDSTPDAVAVSPPPPPKMPKRLRKRLLECKTPSPTVVDINAKLRDADLRRQKFYDELSSKARCKQRSPALCSLQEVDLGHRLEAKLQAAEQKRLSILSEAQTRLARLDKSRQAAKSGVEMQIEKKRKNIGSKVESRFLQAERNRMQILSSYGQRRATIKERRSQSLLRRMTWESKYKERVRNAMFQKRAAAERNRLGLLEAEKKRARARFLQVRRVAKSVVHQREIERRRIEDQLENRLQKARRQRADFLRQRGRSHGSVLVYWTRMYKQADIFSRKIARCWRRFRKLRGTTYAMAKAYDTLKINETSVKLMPFEQLALLIESNATIQTVKCLLDRLESRYKLLSAPNATSNPPTVENIDHLLQRVAFPSRRRSPKNFARTRVAKKPASTRQSSLAKLSRYQVRIVLCAYMILSHPDAVFSELREREISLTKSAEIFVREFEVLIKVILDGPLRIPNEDTDAAFPICRTFRSQLATFDTAWCNYLNFFVVWKVKDAKLLEDDLVKAACHLELSMIQTCKITRGGDGATLTHDMKAIQKQVVEDQRLLREKMQHLSGEAGIERMKCALADTRTKYFDAKEKGSPVGSPATGSLTLSTYCSPAAESNGYGSYESKLAQTDRSSRVVRSLFQDDGLGAEKENLSDPSCLNGLFGENVVSENELIVNEVLHDQHFTLASSVDVSVEDRFGIKAKIQETMEKAFWDGVMNSMEENEPNYDRVVDLVKELRDEICEIAPKSWKQEIIGTIDLDILTQVLNSGNLDMDYLGKILDFGLTTLRRLSAPANDDEMKSRHQQLWIELVETCESGNKSNFAYVVSMVRGLRFVLEQVQALKKEISKARIRFIEPLLKGAAGIDYLKTAFANRYGSPSIASSFLPETVQWLSSVLGGKDEEWSEHSHLLSSLTNDSSSQVLPVTALKSGLQLPVKTDGNRAYSSLSGNQNLDCKGEKVDLSVRLGLLKLVSRLSGLTQEAVPETLKLNVSRLRGVQAQIQRIIVISTSILIARQILLSEQVVASTKEMETIIAKCAELLWGRLEDVGSEVIKEIVETIDEVSGVVNGSCDVEKLRLRKEVLARMLAKSLQDGDAIFGSVSRAIYLAMRGVVLGGRGSQGKRLAEMALQKVGAGVLTSKVAEAAEVLVVAATVSVSVHGAWFGFHKSQGIECWFRLRVPNPPGKISLSSESDAMQLQNGTAQITGPVLARTTSFCSKISIWTDLLHVHNGSDVDQRLLKSDLCSEWNDLIMSTHGIFLMCNCHMSAGRI